MALKMQPWVGTQEESPIVYELQEASRTITVHNDGFGWGDYMLRAKDGHGLYMRSTVPEEVTDPMPPAISLAKMCAKRWPLPGTPEHAAEVKALGDRAKANRQS